MYLTKFCYCCAIFYILCGHVKAKRILGIFPHFGYSHFKVFYPLMHNLSERGHNVTVITYIKAPNMPNDYYEELILEGKQVINIVPLVETKVRTWKGLFDEYVILHNEGQLSCKRLYESGYVEEVLKRHQEQPYDLVITEYFNSDCQLALPYLMKIPVVGLSSCLLFPWYYDRVLLPDTPSYVQSEFVGFQTPLNFPDRLKNFVQAKTLPLLYRYYTNYYDNKLIQHYLNINIDVNEIAKQKTRLILGNQHYALMGVRPLTQKFVEIGGIHINDDELKTDLPLKLDIFLRNAENNVLFISWGSMIRGSSLNKQKLNVILNVLKTLDINVIWKWETDEVPIKSKRFLFIKWAPQLKLLCHPKISIFWGHGGLLSTTEAIYCGKPMLLTPIYGDQFTNAFAVENRKIGRIINFDTFTEDTLETEITKVLHFNYSKKALAISKVFRNRETKPLDTATWWVEHILEHKVTEEVLHSHAVDLNVFVYYSIDVMALILAILIAFMYTIKLTLKLVSYRRVNIKENKLKQN